MENNIEQDRMVEMADLLDIQEELGPNYEPLPDAIVVARGDEAGRICVFTGKAEALFGYGRAEVLGRPIEDLMPERFRLQHRSHRLTYIENPTARTMGRDLELFILRKTGKERRMLISIAPLFHTKYGLLVIADFRDVAQIQVPPNAATI